MTGRLDDEVVSRAHAVPLDHEIHRRGIRLRRRGRELVGPCPVCGGTDRFAVHVQKQIWNCRQCRQGGDIIALVQHVDGLGFHEAVASLTGGKCPAPEPQHAPPAPLATATFAEERHRWAMRLWDDAGPIGGTVAERYLIETRRLVLPSDVSPRVLRFHPACPFGKGAHHPCLLALYRAIAGDVPRAIMRTALTPDARKIDRKALGAIGGAAIKLSDDDDVSMGLAIGEGLETTLAGMMKGFVPAWALGSAGAIAKFPVLSGIDALTVLAETDDGGANERAIQECFARWTAAGRDTYTATSLIGGDLNDAVTAA